PEGLPLRNRARCNRHLLAMSPDPSKIRNAHAISLFKLFGAFSLTVDEDMPVDIGQVVGAYLPWELPVGDPRELQPNVFFKSSEFKFLVLEFSQPPGAGESISIVVVIQPLDLRPPLLLRSEDLVGERFDLPFVDGGWIRDLRAYCLRWDRVSVKKAQPMFGILSLKNVRRPEKLEKILILRTTQELEKRLLVMPVHESLLSMVSLTANTIQIALCGNRKPGNPETQ
ncbi:hypothetical protein, partial [Thalassovita aquimarina]|uniref:hypothetical protein n=1 Tax=Thalassovita aquimarina TaxID=2785917 RepID=UPI001BB0088E